MSKSPKSRASKRALITAVVVILAAVVLARPLHHYAHSRALTAISLGDHQSTIEKSLVWYRVASTLAPHDPAVLTKLAGADIQTGNDQAALTAAQRSIAHGGGVAAYILKSQGLLELDRTAEATTAAETAVQSSTNNAAASLQLGLCYVLAGNSARLANVIALLGPLEPAGTLANVQHNNLALAQELYVLGLLRAPQHILQKQQIDSSEAYLLQARISLQLGHDDKSALEEGRELLQNAVALSPERVDVRQLLQSIDTKLGDTTAAGEQGSQIQALTSGRV